MGMLVQQLFPEQNTVLDIEKGKKSSMYLENLPDVVPLTAE